MYYNKAGLLLTRDRYTDVLVFYLTRSGQTVRSGRLFLTDRPRARLSMVAGDAADLTVA
jgi:hypothetical protein